MVPVLFEHKKNQLCPAAVEMLIESGLDQPAYKFVAAVANSLLADHIVFQSYVSTSSPG